MHTKGPSTATEPAGDAPRRSDGIANRRLDLVMLVLLGAVGVGIAVLSYLQPLAADDLANLNVMRMNPSAWDFMRHFYLTWTGRASGMLLLWFALSYRTAYALLNAVAFGAFAWLIVTVAAGRAVGRSLFDRLVLAVVVAALWFATPSIAETVFWHTGSATYLWSAVLMLAFIAPYRIWHTARGPLQRPSAAKETGGGLAMLVLGGAAGASHEQVAVVLVLGAGALLVRLLHSRQWREFPLRLWAGLAGLAVGCFVQFASPGNAARSALTPVDALTLTERAQALIRYLVNVGGSWLVDMYPWALVLLLLALAGSRILPIASASAGSRSRSLWWLWAIMAMASVGVFVAQPVIANLAGPRTALFAAVLLLVSALSPLADQSASSHPTHLAGPAVRAAVILLLVIVALDAGRGIKVAAVMSAELEARREYVTTEVVAGRRDVEVEPLKTGMTRIVFYGDVTADPEYWVNKAVAADYGADSIVLAPPAE